MTMIDREAIGERRWMPRGGYFCRWKRMGDRPTFYKWDGNRSRWNGSIIEREYNNSIWQSNAQYGGGVKQEYNPRVGQVINATERNVNTGEVLNNQNQKVRQTYVLATFFQHRVQ